MAKRITFTYDGKDYTLEFNRRTVKQMETEGFVARELADKPNTVVPMLISGAFKMHHPFMKQKDVEEIWDSLPDKYSLLEELVEMYNEPVEALMNEPTKGNVVWTVSK